MLSILLPSYNNKCYALVHELQRQCEEYFAQKADKADKADKQNADYEIIVADDGSRDQVSIIANYLINELPHCRYIRRHENVGRSAIRNYLVSEAKGDWVLIMDSDLEIVSKTFIADYMDAIEANSLSTRGEKAPSQPPRGEESEEWLSNDIVDSSNSNDIIDSSNSYDVIYGGVTVCGPHLPHNLRYLYEKEAVPHHTADKRRMAPYQHFHTANFVIRRDVIAAYPFDERIKSYGYEDVLFGKVLKDKGVKILHIDNPAGLGKFESNESYLHKVDEAIKTLHAFEADLRGYSPLLHVIDTLKSCHLYWAVKLWHRLFGGIERRNLMGKNPSLLVLKIYKTHPAPPEGREKQIKREG